MRARTIFCISMALFALPALCPFAHAAGQQITGKAQTAGANRAEEYSDSGAVTKEVLLAGLRSKIKYVFVFYQENRSFDSYFGTFPRAEGIYTNPASATAGFNQHLKDPNGKDVTVEPYRIGPAEYASDTDDVDHSHKLMFEKMNFAGATPQMNKFASVEASKYLAKISGGGSSPLQAYQFGVLTMAHEDCDTIPFLWKYAHSFVLFDHVFQEMIAPSTPGNLSIIAAQAGQTQWVLHPDEATPPGGSGGVPVLVDDDPFWGSPSDATPKHDRMPVNPRDYPAKGGGYSTEINLTFASLPLSLQGSHLGETIKSDHDPSTDLRDVMQDVTFISTFGKNQVPFGWYEEGFDCEPSGTGSCTPADNGSGPITASGDHASYVTHHNGPQYFGYVSNNPAINKQLHGLGDFFTAVEKGTFDSRGGVFFIKGGYTNFLGLRPASPLPQVQKNFLGDDDHPGYSDAQISEALVARGINAIANSKYWDQCVIIITWDDSEGDWDHVQPPVESYGPDGTVLSYGPRVPLIVISPYAKTHYISTQQGSQGSVPKFVAALFGKMPLAELPDEFEARLQAARKGMSNMGPDDGPNNNITDLTEAFDPKRVLRSQPLPKQYVEISPGVISQLPQQSGYGCKQLGIVPTDYAKPNHIPADFSPLPGTVPGKNPYAGRKAAVAH